MPWKSVELPFEIFKGGTEVIGLEEFVGDEKAWKSAKTPKASSKKIPKHPIKKKMPTTVKRQPKRTKTSTNKKRKRQSSDSDCASLSDSSVDDFNDVSEIEERRYKKLKNKGALIRRNQVVDVNEQAQKEALNPPKQKDVESEIVGVSSKKVHARKPVDENFAASEKSRVEQTMTGWSGLGLPVEILKALHESRFMEPTEIQKQAIPAALSEHRDIIAAAETGSGKTLAYGLPLLSHINSKIQQDLKENESESESSKQAQRPLGLILVPTRELAVQVKQNLIMAAKFCSGVQIGLIVGGLSVAKQQRILNQRPAILVATPGRLWQMVREKTAGLEMISSVRYLVVDEADRCVEKAHFAELKMLINYINEHQPERQKRQTMLYSATLTFAQYDVKNKATDSAVLQDKLRNLMENLSMKNRPKIIDLSPAGTTSRSLVEAKVVCNGGEVEKDAVLYSILSQYSGRTLVFANAIATVRKIGNMLRMLFSKPQFRNKQNSKKPAPLRPILVLHAQLKQRIRLKYLDRFRDEPNAILVASDVAARGLDIPNIEHVIHYHVPTNTESYVHRSGRTARLATAGLSILLVDPKVESGRFWRLMANLCRRATTENEDTKAADVADFEIDPTLLAQCRERVSVCKQLEALEHQEKKYQADKKFLTEGGSDFEPSSESEQVDSDNDVDPEYETFESAKRRRNQAATKQLRSRLAHLLTVPLKVSSKVSLTRYPSALGEAITIDSTEAVKQGKSIVASRAIDHIVSSNAKNKKGSLAKQIALAAKIEKRKAIREQMQEEKAKELKRKREEKRKEKRKRKAEKEGGGENIETFPNGKEFMFY